MGRRQRSPWQHWTEGHGPPLIQTMKTANPYCGGCSKARGVLGVLHGDFTIVDPFSNLKTTDDVALKPRRLALGNYRTVDPRSVVRPSESLTMCERMMRTPTCQTKAAVNWSTKHIATLNIAIGGS